jgi:hypothetical protein
MPRAPAELLELLTRHHGLDAVPEPRVRAPRAAFELGDGDHLLGLDDADLAARLEARLAADPADPAAALRAELRAFCGREGRCELFDGLAAARAAAVAAARAATGRTAVLAALGARSEGLDEVVTTPLVDFERTLAAVEQRGADLACLLVEPRVERGALLDLIARARAHGALVVLDESRSAGRLAPATVAGRDGLEADAILLGPSLAAGRPFAALVCAAALDPVGGPAPDPVAAEIARALVARLRAQPVDGRLAALGARLVERCRTAFREQDVHAELIGPPALPQLRFAGQENAEGPLIAHHFQLELAALGVSGAADLALPGDLDDARLDAIAAAFAGAIARIRTLLIEHNSYLSGGIPFVFAGAAPRLAERGIARYRHPKLAEVEVDPVEGRAAMRIAFAPGPLGPITSSGFYLPTRLRGDFDIRVRYEVRTWEPGPDSACLGLFVQNEPSTARYYAQIMSTADRPGETSAAAGLAGELVGRRPVPGRSGWLRLVRRGAWLEASHRDLAEPDFVLLGAAEPCATDDVITGAKIWSKVRCGGLVVDLSELQVEATIPDDQIPRLEPRPDPRHQGR